MKRILPLCLIAASAAASLDCHAANSASVPAVVSATVSADAARGGFPVTLEISCGAIGALFLGVTIWRRLSAGANRA